MKREIGLRLCRVRHALGFERQNEFTLSVQPLSIGDVRWLSALRKNHQG